MVVPQMEDVIVLGVQHLWAELALDCRWRVLGNMFVVCSLVHLQLCLAHRAGSLLVSRLFCIPRALVWKIILV